jgi:hypothetical protein
MGVTRLENESDRLLRAMSASQSIEFGTDAPYAFEPVGFARIGFADIPALGFIGHLRSRDLTALVPMARQHIIRAAVARDMPVHALELRVHLGTESRERMFTDQNEGSKTTGKRKRGSVVRFHLEIIDRACIKAFSDAFGRVYL